MLDSEITYDLANKLRAMIFAVIDQFYQEHCPSKDPGATICIINGVIISDLILMTLKATLKPDTKLIYKVKYLDTIIKTTKKKIIEEHKKVN